MKAVIMAGGEGTRLRPMTYNKPKPMIDILDRPVMEYIIELLKKHDITDIAVTLQYMPQSIINHFGNGSDYGVHLEYFTEISPLGTAGSVKNAEEFLSDDFLVISGDCLTDIDLSKAIDFHFKKKSSATLILSKVDTPLEYGVVVTNKKCEIMRFLEKPSWSEVLSDTVNTGIYIFNKSILNRFDKGVKFDFSRDLFPELLHDREALFGYVAEGYWCDIGDLNSYVSCQRDILDNRVDVNINTPLSSIGAYIDQGAIIDADCEITPPVFIGSNSRIEAKCKIKPYSIIGQNCIIQEGSVVNHSVLHRGVTLKKSAQARGCILCENVNLGSFSSVFEDAVVGEKSVVEDMCKIVGGAKIWPQKFIVNGSTINMNLVWGNGINHTIFGENGIHGEINIDITPEFTTRLGAAFGSILKSGLVGIGYSEGNSLDMLKSAFLSGLLSSGCKVFDFNVQPLPLTRRAVNFYNLNGGAHIALENGGLIINLLDKKGIDISRNAERAIESMLAREDFQRSGINHIQNTVQIQDYSLYYAQEIMRISNLSEISLPLQIHSNSSVVQSLATTVLGKLGIAVSNNTDSPPIGCIKATINNLGSSITLTDELGNLVPNVALLHLILNIIAEYSLANEFVIPISAASCVEKVSKRHHVFVVHCKTDKRSIMQELLKHELYEQFYMMYDPIYFLTRLLSYITEKKVTLHEIIRDLPDMHITERLVSCDPAKKGTVMRTLAPEGNSKFAEISEGIYVSNKKGWTLILPHNDQAVCRIISEGTDAEFATELCDFYAAKVLEISK